MVIAEDWYFWSHRLHIAKAAQRAGYEVALATAQGELQARIEAEGLRYFPIRLDRGSTNPLAEARSVASVTAVMARFRPDVVHLVALADALSKRLSERGRLRWCEEECERERSLHGDGSGAKRTGVWTERYGADGGGASSG